MHFERSAAPLQLAGKTLDPARSGIELAPETKGAWSWVDDKTLQFQPAADWLVGQAYEVHFAARGFAAAHVHLKQYGFRFSSAPFTARVSDTQFYQDPVNAADKKVVVTLAFSHAVDAAGLESRIQLRLYDKLTDTLEREVGKPAFSVQYDKLKLHAYIHSEQLSVPAKQGRVAVEVGAGVQAARGGNRTAASLTASAMVPGVFALQIADLRLNIARDQHDDPRQILLLHTSYSVIESQIVPHVKAWLLPVRHPDASRQAQWERANKGRPLDWGSQSVTPEVLQAAEPLALSYTANEQEHVELHSFGYQADPGRYVYVRVDKGLRSFGGYQLGDPVERTLRVPEYPRELRIAHEGSLLAWSGARKLTVFTRDVPALRVEIARLLPDQLQHLVTQTGGDFHRPEFRAGWSFDASNITERFNRTIRLPKLAPGAAHYEPVDLDAYLRQDGADRRGVFLVRVQAYDPVSRQVLGNTGDSADAGGDAPDDQNGQSDDAPAGTWGQAVDYRLVVVTDLGILAKRSVDGSQDVFVQSIHGGDPVGGAVVDVLGRNGQTLLTQTTDADGHARFADLKGFRREHEPVLYLAHKGADSSFLPIGRGERELDLSRFDVGGVRSAADSGRLSAYLFSDRGIYRPGDEIRVGAIVKAQDWGKALAGLPLRVQVSDPRGAIVKRDAIRLSAAGFEDIRFATRDTSPTGDYAVSLAIIQGDEREDPIGSITVKVQEFLPDRLRMNAHFSAESAGGWVGPDQLRAHIALQNLFGTAAENRRVTAQMTLSPGFPAFAAWPGYQFHDPQAAKEGYSDQLADGKTDEQGNAVFDLNLQRFARATYRVHLVAEGFEADGGRGVAAEATQLVSSLPYLVGWKTDADLDYIPLAAQRQARIVAVDSRLGPIEVKDLRLLRLERRYVSVLTQLDNGTYKYVSRLKEVGLSDEPYPVPAAGAGLSLDTRTPGNFSYLVQDAAGQQYARIDYSVAGAANLAGRMDKNAELQLTLERKDYAPGDDIAMQVVAPYTGAGLITIERDKVFAYKWFKASTTASVQHIKLPEGIDGNAYVAVSFVRDPGSDEIYASPLSYAVQPFSVALDRRTAQVTLEQPQKVKPGQRLAIRYRTDRPARIVVFAVDEGILQVARYQTPKPLAYFFQKRSLDVRTAQILDLILPEFAREASLAAAGGDADAALGRHLNPFKRKTDKPVAYWSGVLDADTTPREVAYAVPEYFNGSLRIMAVAVADDALGVAEARTTVRGDFVLSPNAPTVAAPGDEFEVSVGVANNVEGAAAQAGVDVSVEPSPQLQVLGPAQQTLAITPMHEGVAHFRVRARDEPGAASLRFRAALGDKSAELAATLSVRPPTPYQTRLRAGSFAGASTELPVSRELYPDYRKLQAGVSVLPLELSHGLASYLGNYPYDCTEQLASQAMPAIVLGKRPEFGEVHAAKGADLAGLVAELRTRQNSEGAYRLWPGNSQVVEFVSLYAQQVLLEAADRGQGVPADLIDHGNAYLHKVAARDGDNLDQERDSAYAIYLLTRQGAVTANEAAALQTRLDERYKNWRQDITAAYLASAYQLMKQQRLADKAIGEIRLGALQRYDDLHSPMAADAELLYLLARHFPERAKALPAAFLDTLADRISQGEYVSLSAAETILALDQYASTVGGEAAGKLGIAALARDGAAHALPLPDGLFPQAAFGADATRLRFSKQTDARAYYQVEESGFDRQPPAQAISKGFEIVREYTGGDGKPVTTVKLGQEIDVHVKFRALGPAFTNGVLVDLLPGGFEIVLPRGGQSQQAFQSAAPAAAAPDGDSADGGQAANADGDADVQGGEPARDCSCSFLWWHPQQFPDYADLREDRVVAYGEITPDIQELRYRIKATNVGTFRVPPAYGEALYDRRIQAQSLAGSITVTAP
ncbi:MAG: alpha-2-macroglobulin family protein [Nevskia sp.]|nr:alpha-2-macroglobulin family protein [Nevskia sp.]